MQEHRYELKHFYNGAETCVKFPGDSDLEEIKEHIKSFLKAASWHGETIRTLFNEKEEE